MSTPGESVDRALRDVESLRKSLRRRTDAQVRSAEERGLVKATALAWFNAYRQSLRDFVEPTMFDAIDKLYTQILEGSENETRRARYQSLLDGLKPLLIRARSQAVQADITSKAIAPPRFSVLISDAQMIAILEQRWDETLKCLKVGAHLAATVMMGGLLEGLFLSRINSLQLTPTKLAPVFKATAAPKDKTTGNPLPLKDWGLKDYIDVAHELKWISRSAKDVGEVLRDYRNFIHPQKELSHGITLNDRETEILWSVFQSLSTQILASVGK